MAYDDHLQIGAGREAGSRCSKSDQLQALRKQEIQVRIGKGLESLRLGKGVDGEAVFHRIEAELDQIEPRGTR